MKSILRSTALLSSSSAVILLCGVISAKAWSLLLGPSGLGLVGVLQGLLGVLTLVAGMGIGTGVVRSGAIALAREDYEYVDALRKGAWLLLCALGAPAAILLVAFRAPISRLVLGWPEHASSIAFVGLALLFNLGAGFQVAILNAYHRLASIAKVNVISSIVGTIAGVALVWVWREGGIAPAIVAISATAWGASFYYYKRDLPRLSAKPARQEMLEAAGILLRFGGPFTAAMLSGTGVQFMIPVLVLHTLGAEAVGHYRAAAMISLGYGLVLTSSGPDYTVRVSAVSDRPALLVQLINQQHRMMMVLSIPVILGILALVRYLIPLLYSPQFHLAEQVLEWQLTGDLFRLSAWSMSVVILARNGSLMFFYTEAVAGLSAVIACWFGMRWFGVSGVGIAFMVSAVIHFMVVSAIVRRDIGFVWARENKRIFLAALAAVLLVRVAPLVGLESIRTPIALVFALIASVSSFRILWREVKEVRVVETSSL
jgi:O-antigen/teichoic acid export membrane protein